MTRVIAIANQKGGVGKTTTVVNIGAYAALAGLRTLIIDIDGQGNATSVLAEEPGTQSVFAGGEPQPTGRHNLDIVASSAALPDDEHRIAQQLDGRQVLSGRLDSWRPRYDLMLIDCPPNLGTLPLSALLAADELLIPIQCEYYAMEGLGQILAAIQDLADQELPVPKVAGIVLTMHDHELSLNREVAEEVRRHFPDRVYTNTIPRDIALAAAPSHGRTIAEYDPLSPGGLAYLAVAKELIDGQ